MDKIVEVLKYIILGLVQGIAEVMPISSSAHLKIMETLFGLTTTNLTLEILLHLASLLAVLIYFKNEILKMVIGTIGYLFKTKYQDKNQAKYFLNILIATIPAAVFGILLQDSIEKIFAKLIYVGIALIVTSFIIIYIQKKSNNNKKEISTKDALFIGIFQAVGILPGISRSGVTIAGGVSRGIEKEEATNFAFLMFIPITLGSGIMTIIDISANQSFSFTIPFIISAIVTLLTTFFSLHFLKKLLKNKSLNKFVIYTLVLGIVVTFSSLFF